MSWTALLEYEASCAEDDTPEPALDWLLSMLRRAMEELMQGEGATPLQKANAIARLGNLFLKAYRAAELAKENKALKQHVAELEEQLQQRGGPGGTPSGTPEPNLAHAGPRPAAPVPVAMEKQVALPVTAEPGVQQAACARPSGPVAVAGSRSTRRAAPAHAATAPG